jgi:glycerol-3-phosphate dehydrogenase (NAD(P)+)
MTAPSKPTIAVLGSGSWGTGLALLVARNGHRTRLWGHDPAHQARLARERQNAQHLPGIRFPDNLEICDDLRGVVAAERSFIIAVPSHAFRATLETMKAQLAPQAIVAWATKGLEPGGGKLLSDVLIEVLGPHTPHGVISGPSFAVEVARGLPTALTVAAPSAEVAEAIAAWLRDDHMRVYTSQDVAGVQLGGAIKNVIAIAAGISDGLGFGANARAALITRGLAEITRLGVALGGRPETFMGLAGAGDLILTCTDNTSRNRRLGLGIGEGRGPRAVLTELGQEAEGFATAREVHELAGRVRVEMPICEQVYRVLFEGLAPQAAVEALLKREPKAE